MKAGSVRESIRLRRCFAGAQGLSDSVMLACSSSLWRLIQLLELHPDDEQRVFENVVLLRNQPPVSIAPVQQKQSLPLFIEKRRREDRDMVEPRSLRLEPLGSARKRTVTRGSREMRRSAKKSALSSSRFAA